MCEQEIRNTAERKGGEEGMPINLQACVCKDKGEEAIGSVYHVGMTGDRTCYYVTSICSSHRVTNGLHSSLDMRSPGSLKYRRTYTLCPPPKKKATLVLDAIACSFVVRQQISIILGRNIAETVRYQMVFIFV